MRFALVAIGSRGDLEPFLALGEALRHRGHAVSVATHGDSAALVRAAGLEYRPLPGSAAAFFAQPEIVDAMRARPTIARLARGVRRAASRADKPTPAAGGEDDAAEVAARAMLVVRRYVDDAVADADVAVCGTGMRESLATAPLAVPCALTSWYPATPTAAFPAMGMPRLPLGGTYNLLTHRLAARTEARRLTPSVDAARRLAGLEPGPLTAGSDLPTLYLQSPTVVPPPPDWPEHVRLTGAWHRRTGPPSDDPGEQWWSEGGAPVVISFGSLWPVIPAGWASTVARALVAAGHRVLVVGGPSDIETSGARWCASLDFGAALPRASMLVHHGGFGTGSSALRAGVPQVIVPLFIDHPWWAHRMRALGVAPAAIPLGATHTSGPRAEHAARRFATRVTRAIDRVDEGMRERARRLATRVRSDGGVEAAVDALEAWWPATTVGTRPTEEGTP